MPWISHPAGPLDPERLDAVRAGLAEGLSWGKIAERLHCSKNSVAGLVRRHIHPKVDKPPKPAKPKAAAKSRTYAERKRRAAAKAAASVPSPPDNPVAAVVTLPLSLAPSPLGAGPPPKTCQWLEGEDRRSWRFCDAPTLGGSPWCPVHRAHCYTRSARQEAA